MTTTTLRQAIIEELAERLSDDGLDRVTIRQTPDGMLILRIGDWEESVDQGTATSVLYQISQLPCGSPAESLTRLFYN